MLNMGRSDHLPALRRRNGAGPILVGDSSYRAGLIQSFFAHVEPILIARSFPDAEALLCYEQSTEKTINGQLHIDGPGVTAINRGGRAGVSARPTAARFREAQNTDAELFLRYRDEGDVAAFETLFKRHRDALMRHLWLLCGNEAIADDLSQYCWMRLVESDGERGYQPTPGASLRSYLFTLGRNRYIDEYKRKHVETKSEDIDDHATLTAAGGNAADGATKDELRGLIEWAIGQLPDEQREVLGLWVEGYSIREMSEITGAPPDTVTSRKKYAMKKMHTLFDKVGLRTSHE